MREDILNELHKLYSMQYIPEDAYDILAKLKQYRDVCPDDLIKKLDSGISHCLQEIKCYENTLKKAKQQDDLRKTLDVFSSCKVYHINYMEFSDNSIELFVDLNSYEIHIKYNWKQEIWMSIWHVIKRKNIKEIHSIFPKADDLVPLVYDNLFFVRGKYLLNSSFETWPKDIEIVLSNIRKNISYLANIFDNCTLRFPDGIMKTRRKSWKSPAKILNIHQESSREFIQGIKKSHQPLYDNTPGLLGSNGTYVGYEEKKNYLEYKIIRPSIEQYDFIKEKVEIESFIRDYFLPKKRRERMSAKLEDEITKISRNRNKFK